MMDVAAEASALGIERARFYETELVSQLQDENGVTVTTPDVTEFQDALLDLRGELATEMNLTAAMDALFQ